MAVPKYYEFMPAIINYLSDGEIHTSKEIIAYCSDVFHLTDVEINQLLSSGQNMLYSRVGWANTYLKKAGLIDSPKKAHFCLTETRKAAYQKGADCVTLKYLDQFDSFKQFRKRSSKQNESDGQQISSENAESPQEQIESALKELTDELVEDLMIEIMKISSYDFERLVVKLLIAMGYGRMEENTDAVTPRSGDEDIDGIVSTDKYGACCDP